MAVEAYVGTYVSAESATNYIDIVTIQSGCQFMIEESNNFQEAAELLQNAADTCDNEAFSIQGVNMQNTINDCATSLLKYQKDVVDKSNKILKAAQAALDKKQRELNEAAKSLDRQARINNK